MSVSSNVCRSSSRKCRGAQKIPLLRGNVAGRRRPMENVTNTFNTNPNRGRERRATLGKGDYTHHITSTSLPPPLSNDVTFTLPALSFSLEKDFWDDVPLPTDACQPPRMAHPPKKPQSTWSDIRIRSVTHPNSPYVPWSEDQRQCILASTETLGGVEAISDDNKGQVRVPCAEAVPIPAPCQDTLRRRVLRPIMKCLRSLYSSVHVSPSIPGANTSRAPNPIDDCTTTLTSVQTTSLEDWLAEKRLELAEDAIRMSQAYTSLDEYEQNGSWIRRTLSTDPVPPRSVSLAFSLDCIPSPSPTIISFPDFSF